MIPVSFNKVLYVTPSYPDLSGVTTHLFLYNYHAVMARLIENDNLSNQYQPGGHIRY